MPQCCRCGFLALRHPEYPNDYFEAPTEYRNTGLKYGNVLQNSTAACLRTAADIHRETIAVARCGTPDQPDRRELTVIACDRICDKFTPWVQGIGPREQLKMTYEEDQQRKHEERMAADKERNDRLAREQRDWQEKESEKNRKAQSEEHQRNRNTQRLGYGVAFLAALVAAYVTHQLTQSRETHSTKPELGDRVMPESKLLARPSHR